MELHEREKGAKKKYKKKEFKHLGKQD